MKALILNNNVVDVVEKEFEVHESLIWMDCPVDCTTDWIVKDDVVSSPPEPAPLSYKVLRRYPEVGNQLDMLYHAIEAGSLDTNSEFFTTLKAVKAKYPKPE
jgi:hypothetical protein